MTEIEDKNTGYGHIYKITNIINEMSYIGYTKKRGCVSRGIDTINQVISNYSKCSYLYNAIMKYGIENFKEEMIEDNIPLEIIHKQESYWMNVYDTIPPNGYNLIRGVPYYFMSEELRERLRKFRKKWWDEHPEIKQNFSELQKKLYLECPEKWIQSEESRKKNSEAHKREKNHFYGKHHTEETKKLISKKAIERYQEHPELREWTEKRREHHKKAMNRSEVKDKISKLTKGEKNPFYGRHHTEETKIKMSKKQKEWRNKRNQRYERAKQENDFINMKKEDLYELAKNNKVKNYFLMKKQELIEYFINLNKKESEE